MNNENQIKNGYSSNNQQTPLNNSKYGYRTNFTERDTHLIGSSYIGYSSNQDTNSIINANKYNSTNSRITSRRQANNIDTSNVSNNSYFGNTPII